MNQAFLFLTMLYGLGLGATEPCEIQFTGRDGQPAPIDTSTKPVRVELEDSALAESRGRFLNINPTGRKGEFMFDFETLATGGMVGAFVADRDMTPEGEEELRVPFALLILEEEGATGAAMNFGAGRLKTPAPTPAEERAAPQV